MRTVIKNAAVPEEALSAVNRLPSSDFGRGKISPSLVEADSKQSFTITYIAGRRGLPQGNGITIAFPQHGWSPPSADKNKDGYICAENTGSASISIEVGSKVGDRRSPHVSGWVTVKVISGELKEGDEIIIYYGGKGQDAPGAEVQNQPVKTMPFVMCYALNPLPSFMGDVDDKAFPGYSAFLNRLAEEPKLEVVTGKANRIDCVIPSVATPGESLKAKFVLTDKCRNPALSTDTTKIEKIIWNNGTPLLNIAGGIIECMDFPSSGFPIRVDINIKAPDELGFKYLHFAWDGEEFISNPIEVAGATQDKVFWADLHGQGAQSDGIGEPAEYFERARDWFFLDIAALTDHSDGLCWPLMMWEQKLREDKWDTLCNATRRFNRDAEFVTFPAMELSSDIIKYPSGINERNHRNAYFYDEDDSVCFSWREYPDTMEWFRIMNGRRYMQIPHTHEYKLNCAHHNPVHERLIEVFSDKKSGEYFHVPGKSPTEDHGGFLEFLKRGYRVGFVGGGDYHCNVPGRHYPAKLKAGYMTEACQGGYAAVISKKLTRAGIWGAMHSRKTYATTGARIIIHFSMTHREYETHMGEEKVTGLTDRSKRSFSFSFALTTPLKEIILVRQGIPLIKLSPAERCSTNSFLDMDYNAMTGKAVLVDTEPLAGLWMEARSPLPSHKFIYYYVKAVQEDGDTVWASPVWLTNQQVILDRIKAGV
ncbi:MAG: DUF3604 domain-containing protein [Victivallales bacterium]